jgi:hypothetical protein
MGTKTYIVHYSVVKSISSKSILSDAFCGGYRRIHKRQDKENDNSSCTDSMERFASGLRQK